MSESASSNKCASCLWAIQHVEKFGGCAYSGCPIAALRAADAEIARLKIELAELGKRHGGVCIALDKADSEAEAAEKEIERLKEEVAGWQRDANLNAQATAREHRRAEQAEAAHDVLTWRDSTSQRIRRTDRGTR